MKIDLEKIKRLPPDVRKEFMKTYLQHAEKKKEAGIRDDFMKFDHIIVRDHLSDLNFDPAESALPRTLGRNDARVLLCDFLDLFDL